MFIERLFAPHIVAIGMPGPFELLVLLGMIAVPIAAAITVVWVLTRNRG